MTSKHIILFIQPTHFCMNHVHMFTYSYILFCVVLFYVRINIHNLKNTGVDDPILQHLVAVYSSFLYCKYIYTCFGLIGYVQVYKLVLQGLSDTMGPPLNSVNLIQQTNISKTATQGTKRIIRKTKTLKLKKCLAIARYQSRKKSAAVAL
jgi:hypothetical protein